MPAYVDVIKLLTRQIENLRHSEDDVYCADGDGVPLFEADERYDADLILSERSYTTAESDQLEYLIKWRDYGVLQSTWEPEYKLAHVQHSSLMQCWAFMKEAQALGVLEEFPVELFAEKSRRFRERLQIEAAKYGTRCGTSITIDSRAKAINIVDLTSTQLHFREPSLSDPLNPFNNKACVPPSTTRHSGPCLALIGSSGAEDIRPSASMDKSRLIGVPPTQTFMSAKPHFETATMISAPQSASGLAVRSRPARSTPQTQSMDDKWHIAARTDRQRVSISIGILKNGHTKHLRLTTDRKPVIMPYITPLDENKFVWQGYSESKGWAMAFNQAVGFQELSVDPNDSDESTLKFSKTIADGLARTNPRWAIITADAINAVFMHHASDKGWTETLQTSSLPADIKSHGLRFVLCRLKGKLTIPSEFEVAPATQPLPPQIAVIDPERLFTLQDEAPMSHKIAVLCYDTKDQVQFTALGRELSQRGIRLHPSGPQHWGRFVEKYYTGAVLLSPNFRSFHQLHGLPALADRNVNFFQFGLPSRHDGAWGPPPNQIFQAGTAVYISDECIIDHPQDIARLITSVKANHNMPGPSCILGRPGLLQWLESLVTLAYSSRNNSAASEEIFQARKLVFMHLFSWLEQRPWSTNIESGTIESSSGSPVQWPPMQHWHDWPDLLAQSPEQARNLIIDWYAHWAIAKRHTYRRFIVIKNQQHPAVWQQWQSMYGHLRFMTLTEFLTIEEAQANANNAAAGPSSDGNALQSAEGSVVPQRVS